MPIADEFTAHFDGLGALIEPDQETPAERRSAALHKLLRRFGAQGIPVVIFPYVGKFDPDVGVTGHTIYGATMEGDLSGLNQDCAFVIAAARVYAGQVERVLMGGQGGGGDQTTPAEREAREIAAAWYKADGWCEYPPIAFAETVIRWIDEGRSVAAIREACKIVANDQCDVGDQTTPAEQVLEKIRRDEIQMLRGWLLGDSMTDDDI